jgi:prepilin-type N-terminal cleavage/methylation domain-containing protein
MDSALQRRGEMHSNRGFSLVETLVAAAVLSVGIGTLAQLAVAAMRATERARSVSLATIVAQEKLEDLRSRLSMDEVGPLFSPEGVLDSTTGGFSDFVDRSGHVLGSGLVAPPNTRFVRRWSLRPATGVPGLVVLQIRVLGVESDEVRIVTAVAPQSAVED